MIEVLIMAIIITIKITIMKINKDSKGNNSNSSNNDNNKRFNNYKSDRRYD